MNVKNEINRTGAQEIQNRLAADILAGRLIPGARLKLSEISDRYGSGMSPLREAMAGLSGMGLVLQEGQRGFRVAPVSLADLQDVIAMRSLLEVKALTLAISNGDVEWEAKIIASYHRLTRHQRTSQQLIDEQWERLHRDFHLSLIEACHSARLFSYCDTLLAQFDRYRRIAVIACNRHAILTKRDGLIVEATLARDAVSACQLLSEHMAESGNMVIEMFHESHPSFC